METKIERAVLVYQAGIANVFAVDCFNARACGREEHRLTQGDFRSCEWYAMGLAAAGVKVASVVCNKAGDISRQDWSLDLEDAPFSDRFLPVFSGVNPDTFGEDPTAD